VLELHEGQNCWRRSHIRDGGFILSGQDFFRAFRQALLQAERYVYILAWDISESIELARVEGFDDGYPLTMNEFIFSVLDARPELEIYILLWDYSMVYLAEREWLPFTKWREKGHPQLHLETDDAIDIGASHHQKVIVVDDALAFCGGFDLSTWRWDTTEHHPDDPRRTTPNGESYQPYHDVQVVCTGEVAKDLGDLCAQRWLRGTGNELPRRDSLPENVPWPASVTRDLKDTEVGIALTYSSYKEYQAAFQIRALYLDIIRSAEHYIYIENQYLSSHEMTNALITRLKDKEGPEIVIILTREAGWAEESTLGVLRDRLLEKLVKADRYGRFSVFYPFVEDESGQRTQVYVHAKLLIADDRMIIAGSANLSNRSMKVDSEVDLILTFQNAAEEVRHLLHRLLAIHFNCSEDVVIRSRDNERSLCSMIEELGNGRLHRLRKLEAGTSSFVLRKLADTQLLDPDEPLSPASWMREVIQDNQEKKKKTKKEGGDKPKRLRYLKWSLILLVGVLTVWLLNTLWGGVLDKEVIAGYLEGFRNSPLIVPIITVIFLVSGLITAPLNVLLVASTVAIGPWITLGCGLSGSLLSAAIAFWAGKRFGKPLLQKMTGEKLEKLSQKLARRGVLSIALIRLVPVAPFVVVNLVAGFSKIRFSPFFFGSILGMVPGMSAVVWITEQVQSAVAKPHWQTWLLVIISLLVFGLLIYFLRKNFK
jgi:phosphatidylserine/phosphatidylglycerophosphate/cardiolipin synthase-like enzyme/membrane protein DedA with SNARE-associated domain